MSFRVAMSPTMPRPLFVVLLLMESALGKTRSKHRLIRVPDSAWTPDDDAPTEFNAALCAIRAKVERAQAFAYDEETGECRMGQVDLAQEGNGDKKVFVTVECERTNLTYVIYHTVLHMYYLQYYGPLHKEN